jgi:hypothetical protein
VGFKKVFISLFQHQAVVGTQDLMQFQQALLGEIPHVPKTRIAGFSNPYASQDSKFRNLTNRAQRHGTPVPSNPINCILHDSNPTAARDVGNLTNILIAGFCQMFNTLGCCT